MERTKKFQVTATSGKRYIWTFTEFKEPTDYGNGVYLGVETPSKDYYSLDCRYLPNYSFHKVCTDYLLKYYGENLDELEEIE